VWKSTYFCVQQYISVLMFHVLEVLGYTEVCLQYMYEEEGEVPINYKWERAGLTE